VSPTARTLAALEAYKDDRQDFRIRADMGAGDAGAGGVTQRGSGAVWRR
jgi:hypothetical protein